MSWHSVYSNPISCNNSNLDNYVNLLKNQINTKTNEEIIETKLSEIENEYELKIKELDIICSNLNVDEYKTKNSLIILQKEVEVVKLLTKYALQNNHLDYNFFLKSLKYLFELSEILRIRLNQKEIIHENKVFTPGNLPRCSYKFCSYKDNCVYNYNLNNKSQCYQDHYVHRMVSADLAILIEYIDQKFKDQYFVIHNKEILKTINTLSFVINHMENELKSKCMYLDEKDIEKCHFIKKID